MRQLTGQDSIYLNLEGNETSAHVSALMLFDQSIAKDELVTFKQILEHVNNCLPDLPVLTQKVVEVPFQLDYPFLGFDEEFDLEFHVRHIALPQPGDWRQLCIQASRIHARGLDMKKPLWEMYIIEGVDDAKDFPKGSFALLFKIHHALVDGGAFTVMLSKLLDITAQGIKRTPVTRLLAKAPSRSEALLMAVKSAYVRPFTFTKLVGKLIPDYVRSQLKNSHLSENLTKPRTRFNGLIGPHRAVDGAVFDLKEFNGIRHLVSGSTLNDVALAVCGGALRKYLSKYDELPSNSLIAGAPVNLNTERVSASDNDISLIQLPIHSEISDPLERLKAVYKSSSCAKKKSIKAGNRNMGDLSKQIPAPILSLASNLLYKSGLISNFGQPFNMVITNVPGPRQPLYFCGAEMKGLFGIAPLAHTLGLVISQFSYNGKIFFCITADRNMLPDPEFLVECLQSVFEQYVSLANKD